MTRPISERLAAATLVALVLVPAATRDKAPSPLTDSPAPARLSSQDVLKLAGTSWRCTTPARIDDPPRQGYLYFHPGGQVKMVQVIPASNRDRANNVLWWPTREEYDFEDPTGRKWTDLDRLDNGTLWASRRDQVRIVYGSPAGLIVLNSPRNRTMRARFAELDARSRGLVDRGYADPFALSEQPAHSRSAMTCELRPGWLQ